MQAGDGGIVGVLGEAGLGKSRLVAEVRHQVDGTEVLWLEGRALSFGQTLSYWPFLEIFRGWTGITEEDSEAESQGKLDRRVRALFPEVADVLPYLATLLGLPVPAELEQRVKYLDGEAMGRQVFRSVRRVFEYLARQRPVVLVFEDLHWVDQSSTELAWGLTLRGTLAQLSGSSEEAATDLQQAIELSTAIPDHANVVHASALLGRCYLRQGKLPEALTVLDGAARIIRERGLRGLTVVQAPLALAEASLMAADEAEGAERTEALGRAKRLGREALKQGRLMRYSLPSALRFRGTYQWLRGRPGAARKTWRRSIAVAEELGARYDVGMTCLEMGRRTGERPPLERAEAILAEIGATRDLADVRRLLSGGRT